MAKGGNRKPPDIRVVNGSTGAIDSDALQRNLDNFRATIDIAHSLPITGLSDTDIDIIRLEVDPTVSPGRQARIGSIAMRIRPGSFTAGYYIKTGKLDTDWDRLVQAGRSGIPIFYPFPTTSSALTTIELVGTNSYATYMGRTPVDITSLSARWATSREATKIDWGEIAIATGKLVLGGNPILTVCGYKDITSQLLESAGNKTTTISMSTEIIAGTDIWVIFSSSAATQTALLVAFDGDTIASGTTASLTNVRPSNVLNSAASFTADTKTTPTANSVLVV
jgi:hypothetical protein